MSAALALCLPARPAPRSTVAQEARALVCTLTRLTRLTVARSNRLDLREIATLFLMVGEGITSKQGLAMHLGISEPRTRELLSRMEARYLVHTRLDGNRLVCTATWEGEAVVRKLLEDLR